VLGKITQIARHPMRPLTQRLIFEISTDFDELAGDRAYADDKGYYWRVLPKLDGIPIMVIGHFRKGGDTQEEKNQT